MVAREDLTVLVVSRQALEHELFLDSWSGVFVRALAERFRDLDSQLDEARREQRDGRLARWIRELVLVSGRAVGDGRWEAAWSEIVAAAQRSLNVDEAALLGVVERSPHADLDRARAVLVIASAGGAAARP